MGRRLVRSLALGSWRVPGAEHQVRDPESHEELGVLLEQKLLEEVAELFSARSVLERMEELADIMDVLDGYMMHHAINHRFVNEIRVSKIEKSGDFVNPLVWDTN